jgi:hypothetical protein
MNRVKGAFSYFKGVSVPDPELKPGEQKVLLVIALFAVINWTTTLIFSWSSLYYESDSANLNGLKSNGFSNVYNAPWKDFTWMISLLNGNIRKAHAKEFLNGSDESAVGEGGSLNDLETGALRGLVIYQGIVYLIFTALFVALVVIVLKRMLYKE